MMNDVPNPSSRRRLLDGFDFIPCRLVVDVFEGRGFPRGNHSKTGFSICLPGLQYEAHANLIDKEGFFFVPVVRVFKESSNKTMAAFVAFTEIQAIL